MHVSSQYTAFPGHTSKSFSGEVSFHFTAAHGPKTSRTCLMSAVLNVPVPLLGRKRGEMASPLLHLRCTPCHSLVLKSFHCQSPEQTAHSHISATATSTLQGDNRIPGSGSRFRTGSP